MAIQRFNEKYTAKLAALPSPGLGAGFHTGMLSLANYGKLAGMTATSVFEDLRAKADGGSRQVPDIEILSAIEKAYRPGLEAPGRPKRGNDLSARASRVFVNIFKRLEIRKCLTEIEPITEDDLRARSPIKIPGLSDRINRQAACLLEHLYRESDLIFLGGQYDSYQPYQAGRIIRKLKKYPLKKFRGLPFIIPNPLSGLKVATKSGGFSYRSDASVKERRFVVVEFDNKPISEQLWLWANVALPIAALIFSGGKSIHGWIDMRAYCENASAGLSTEEWQSVVTYGLKIAFVELGADRSTFNPSRLSRLPGQYRPEKKTFQRLIYLNPSPSGTAIVDSGKEAHGTKD